MDVNNASFKLYIFLIGSLLDLQDTLKAFWWVSLNVNLNLVIYKKTPQDTFNLCYIVL